MAPDATKKKGKASRAKPKVPEKEVSVKKPVAESPLPVKRKATEDVSPVAVKKAKSGKTSVKKAAAEETKTKPAPKKDTKKPKKEQQPAEPVEEADDLDSDSDDEGDGRLALARTLGHSDDEEEGTTTSKSLFKTGQDVGKIPKVPAKTKKSLGGSSDDGPRVIYIGHIPFGFFEHEIRQYLSQFGLITNLRLSRNKRTGASKGYAFVEFKDASTAAIVAKTMDSYLLFGHILKVKLVPLESQHEDLFKGANRRFKKVPWTKMAGRELQKPRGEAEWNAKVQTETKRRSARASKLKEIGYEFEPPALKAAVAVAVSAVEAEAPVALEAPTKEDEQPKAIEAPPPAAAEKSAEVEGVVDKKKPASAKAKTTMKAKKGGAKAKKVKS